MKSACHTRAAACPRRSRVSPVRLSCIGVRVAGRLRRQRLPRSGPRTTRSGVRPLPSLIVIRRDLIGERCEQGGRLAVGWNGRRVTEHLQQYGKDSSLNKSRKGS